MLLITFFNFRIDCEFQLQSIGDVAIECIKVTIKEQSCKYIVHYYSKTIFFLLNLITI